MANPPLTRTQAADDIRKVFAGFNAAIPVDDREVSVTDNLILLKGDILPQALFDFAFPKSRSEIYFHFTTYNRFKQIASSGKLKLFNLHRRFRSGEFRTFCRDYELDGYLRGPEGAEDGIYRELMDDLFYVSFVDDPDTHSSKLWQTFGHEHRGVRLAFQVNLLSDYQNFRQVSYQNNTQVPIIKAMQAVARAYGRKFVSEGMSRMGGFYQRLDYAYQTEHRLLVKLFPNEPSQFQAHAMEDEDYKFIECDLENRSCTAFEVKLVEVVTGTRRSVEDVRRYVAEQSRFPDVKVISESAR